MYTYIHVAALGCYLQFAHVLQTLLLTITTDYYYCYLQFAQGGACMDICVFVLPSTYLSFY